MTYEEAINHIKPIFEASRDVSGIGLFEQRPITVALGMAIEALEKQIPKKVKKYNLKFYTCPNCGNGYGGFFDMLHFCWNCGQALNWEDIE